MTDKTSDEIVVVLEPEDEYTHEPDEAENYNESMYLNAFDLGCREADGSGSATGSTRATPR